MLQPIVTNSAHNNKINSDNVQKMQEKIATLVGQGSSGKKAKDYLTLSKSSNLESVIWQKEQVKKIMSSSLNNEKMSNRLNHMAAAVYSTYELASNMRSLMAQRSNPDGDNMHLTEIIKNQFFPAIADNLNTNIEGRYLFSGNKTNTRAVTDLDKQTNIINNTITSNYYQGNSTILSMQVSENLTLTYGVTADHVAFKNLIACANKAISSDLSNNQNEMAETSRLLQTTIDQLINLHSNISNNIKAIEDANDSLKSKKVNIASDLAKIDDVDQATLMMEFKSEKNALIGTFKIAAEMKDMSLLNYLK